MTIENSELRIELEAVKKERDESVDILKRIAKSEVILNAPLISYSEAFLILQQFLAKLENKESV